MGAYSKVSKLDEAIEEARKELYQELVQFNENGKEGE